jgi:hypothetical protein
MRNLDTRNPISLRAEAIRLYTEEGMTVEEVGKHLHKGREWMARALEGIPKRRPRPPTIAPILPPPVDTRPLGARLMGDPLPGRSALDQRRQA